MRRDAAEPVTEELQALAAEHAAITENIWTEMIRVAAIEYRQAVLIDRLSELRFGVPVAQ